MRSSYDIAIDAKLVIPDGNDERSRQMTQTAEKVNLKEHFPGSYDQAMTVCGSAADDVSHPPALDGLIAKSQLFES
jgi:hypothetical protein